MRTTVRLDDNLLDQAKREAQLRGQTLTSLIDEGLRLVLAQPKHRPRRKRYVIPVSKMSGWVWPGIDINNSAALLDIMEDPDWKPPK